MKVLTLGRMSGREIAEWMSISYDGTYRKNPKCYKGYLKDYCDFEEVYGGVIIKEIYCDIWLGKGVGREADKFFRKEMVECIDHQNGLASVSGITKKHCFENNIPPEQEENYRKIFTKCRKFYFGDNLRYGGQHGIAGERDLVWAVKLNKDNSYRPMEKHEFEILKLIFGDIYKINDSDKAFELATLELDFKRNKVDKDTYVELKDRLLYGNSGYVGSVIDRFRQLTGTANTPVRISEHLLYTLYN